MRAAGLPVAVASDNCRDPFYAYGDLDMLEVLREATRILQLDHSGRPWLRLLGPAPAGIMRLDTAGRIAVGGPAPDGMLSDADAAMDAMVEVIVAKYAPLPSFSLAFLDPPKETAAPALAAPSSNTRSPRPRRR